MTIIDQRILIPAGPDVVWGIISDINNNPRWQVDCQSISFLTSMRAGPGMRWRYTSLSGQEFVIETTAWYNQLGYEYIFVDGAPFRSSKGTIRLQEIAEGTIVQWTLNYEIGGVLGGMRNALSVRRHYSGLMVDSLKGLWSYLKESGKARQSHEAKSLMRDALDYEARAQYTPRHPSRITERENELPDEEPVLQIEEPPVADEDTRPNPALVTEPEAVESVVEPAPEEPPDKADIRRTDEWKIPSVEPELTRYQRPSAPEPPMPLDTPSKPLEPIIDEPAPAEEIQSAQEPVAEMPQPELPAAEPATIVEPPPAADDSGPKIDTSKLDTREISIWEVFGVLSPSDTERMKAITDQQLAELAQADASGADAKPAEPAAEAAPAAVEAVRLPVSGEETRPITVESAASRPTTITIVGLRIMNRRSRVRLRRRA